jgi:excisionase family DNA binding protein
LLSNVRSLRSMHSTTDRCRSQVTKKASVDSSNIEGVNDTESIDTSKPRERFGYKEAAEFLGVSEGTLRGYVCQKRIPHVRFGPRLVRFERRALEKWLAERRVA